MINLWPVTAVGYDARGYRIGFAVALALAIALGAWVWMLAQTRHPAARADG